MQYAMARMLSYLPPRLQVLLSGAPPLEIDGLRFDSQAQLLGAFRKRRVRYGLIEPTVEVGRARYRHETRVFRGPVTEVAAVREFAIGDLRVRHYSPGVRAPLTVYLHGGGFVIGDLDTHDEPCRILCKVAGVHVLSVEYRLAPEHPFPAALEDTRAALRWAQQNAESIGADPQRVTIGGDSAGANLATVAARLDEPPFAQLLIYPATDSAASRRSHELFGRGFVLTSKDGLEFGRHYTAGKVPKDDPRVSPIYAKDLARLPRALVVTAGFDLLRDEGEAYADAMAAAGVSVRRKRVATLAHGFIHLTGICRTAKREMIDIATEWRALLEN